MYTCIKGNAWRFPELSTNFLLAIQDIYGISSSIGEPRRLIRQSSFTRLPLYQEMGSMIIFESSKSLSSLFRSANLPKKFYEFFFLFVLHTVRRHANDPIIDPIINPIGGTFLEKRVCPGFCFPPPAKKNGPFIRSSENTFSAKEYKPLRDRIFPRIDQRGHDIAFKFS